jgi:hypothetical protein
MKVLQQAASIFGRFGPVDIVIAMPGTVEVTGLGWGAYIAGGVFTLALSAGLFLLSFHSARHGYDDIDRPETPED